MVRRRILPHEWRNLPASERADMLAYQVYLNQRWTALRAELLDVMPDEMGMLAQAIIAGLRLM
jgi:hypothetical protein